MKTISGLFTQWVATVFVNRKIMGKIFFCGSSIIQYRIFCTNIIAKILLSYYKKNWKGSEECA